MGGFLLNVQDHTALSPYVVPLAMGAKNIPVGFVKVWNDASYLHVIFEIDAASYPSYYLIETHLNVSKLPQSWSAPGLWTYAHENVNAIIDEYIIPLSAIDGGVAPGTIIYLMAHATIGSNGEHVGSAYGGYFKGSFNYTIQEGVPPQEPQLSIFKTGPVYVMPGGIYFYTIIVENFGNTTAYNVTVVDYLPNYVTPLDTTAPGTPAGTYNGGANTVTWSLGELGIGAVQTLTLEITIDNGAPHGTQLKNNVKVFWENSTGASYGPANSSWNSTVVSKPCLVVEKVGPTVARPNSLIDYVITVENVGNSTAYNVVVEDSLPGSLIYISSSPAATVVGNKLTWNFPSISSLEKKYIYVTARVSGEVTNGTQMDNLVSVKWEDFENNLYGPEESAWKTTVITAPLLTIVKTGPLEAGLNQTVTYKIKVSNIGGSSAYNLMVEDKIPEGFTYVSSMPNGVYDAVNRLVTWTVDELASSDEMEFELKLKTPETISGLFLEAVNNATVTWRDDEGASYGPVWDTLITVVFKPAKLEINKWGDDKGYLNDTLTFYINVTNVGGSIATNIKVYDFLPPGLEPLSSTPNYVLCNPALRMICWNFANLAPGETRTIILTVNVTDVQRDGIILLNLANVNYTDQLTGELFGPVSDVHPITLYVKAYDEITKIGPLETTPGSIFNYTISVRNPTLTALENVNLTDYLPTLVEYVSSNPLGDYNSTMHTVFWEKITLPPITTLQFTITVKVKDDAPPGKIINLAESKWSGGFSMDIHKTLVEVIPPSAPPAPPVGGWIVPNKASFEPQPLLTIAITVLLSMVVALLFFKRRRT